MALGRAFSLITFPIIARQLSVADYGTLDLFLVVSGFFVTLMVFGQDSAVGRLYYEHESLAQRRQLVSQSLLIQFIVCLIASGLLLFFARQVGSLLSSSDRATQYMQLIVAQLPFMAAINFSQNILKWTFARRAFLIMSIGYSAVQALILLGVAIFVSLDIEVTLSIILLTNCIFGGLGLYLVRQWLVVPRVSNYVNDLLRFAIPIGFVCVLGAAVSLLERRLIENLLGADGLGFYAAGAKVAMLLALAVGAFQTAWGPFSTSIHKAVDASRTYNSVLAIFALAVCILVMLLDAVANPLITLLASERYANATVVVFPLTMGIAVQAISWITEVGIGLSKRTAYFIYPHALFIVAITGAMMFLVPICGLLGAALSMLMAQIVRSLLASYLAQRIYPLTWDYAWVFLVVICTIVTGLIARVVVEPLAGFWAVLATYLFSISCLSGLFCWRRLNVQVTRQVLRSLGIFKN